MPYKDPAKRRASAVIQQTKYLKAHPEKAKEKKDKWYKRSYDRRKGKIKEFTKRWRENNPDKIRGIHEAWYKKKRAERDAAAPRLRTDRCEICNTFGQVVYDHDHVSGKFRTWACNRCNTVMGFVRDDPELLRAIACHLESFQESLNK